MAHRLSLTQSITTCRRARSGCSLATAARDGGHHTQSDVHGAGDPALAREEPWAAAQPARRRARAERIGAVGENAQQHEEQAESEDLRFRTAAREIDELRQERQEE